MRNEVSRAEALKLQPSLQFFSYPEALHHSCFCSYYTCQEMSLLCIKLGSVTAMCFALLRTEAAGAHLLVLALVYQLFFFPPNLEIKPNSNTLCINQIDCPSWAPLKILENCF